MIQEYIQNNDDEEEYSAQELQPRDETEYANARAFLQTASSFSGENLYDHLTEVLNKIIAERPENVIDFFEEYSRKIKEKRFRPQTDRLEDVFIPPGKYSLASKILPLLKPFKLDEPSTQDPDDLQLADMRNNNLLDLIYCFENVGLGLPRLEMYCLTLHMRQLTHMEPIISIRFWGKIFGLYKNYYVLETELKEEEVMKRNEQLQEAEIAVSDERTRQQEQVEEENEMEKVLRDVARQQEVGGEGFQREKVPRSLPPIPQITHELPREVPVEFSGVGINKKVYYVCNDIGQQWIQLPNVTPKQLQVSRQIYKSFSGNLDEEINTYPEFPWKERYYLRAQIARISAGTQISPLGFYTFEGGAEGEEEEEEEPEEEPTGGPKTAYKENLKYDPPPIKDLVDGSMSFWVHITPYILPQGRNTWWNPNPLPDVQEEEAGEEEESPKRAGGSEPETGPPLLTPCSEDASLETVPAWSVRASSSVLEEYAVAVVRSNIWPGAYCFSTPRKTFQNVYMGYGLKYMAHNFSPTPLSHVQQDYPIGPEIMEITDPSGAEEDEWRIAHLPKPPIIKDIGEEAGEEAEEEEDDEESDDE